MSENKSSRVLVNIIGVPSLLGIIILGDTFYNLPVFSIFIAIVLFLGAIEIKSITKNKDGEPMIEVLVLFLFILQLSRHHHINLNLSNNELIMILTVLIMILEIFRAQIWRVKTSLLNISTVIFSFVWLGIMLGSLVELRNLPGIGYKITLVTFLSVWICDTSAFLFGKKFGNEKILPFVSPNKTWLGTLAGLVSSIVFLVLLYGLNYFNGTFSMINVLVIGVITGGIGQFGDWAESLLKRESGIKDTSNLLKGHGGILDRFDSLAFSAPVILIYCNYIGLG